jgi:hypothetical protein
LFLYRMKLPHHVLVPTLLLILAVAVAVFAVPTGVKSGSAAPAAGGAAGKAAGGAAAGRSSRKVQNAQSLQHSKLLHRKMYTTTFYQVFPEYFIRAPSVRKEGVKTGSLMVAANSFIEWGGGGGSKIRDMDYPFKEN